MFPVASIFHCNQQLNRDRLLGLMQETGFSGQPHVWQGLTLAVEQVRFTSGCDICFQIDDEPDEIAEEVAELAQVAEDAKLETELVSQLQKSTARISVLPFQADATEDVYREWLSTGVQAVVPADATLENPHVLKVIEAVAKCLGAIVYDHVEDRFV